MSPTEPLSVRLHPKPRIIPLRNYPRFYAIAYFWGYFPAYTTCMGNVEIGARKKRRARNYRDAALMAVGAAGLIAVAAMAPSLVRLLETTGVNARLRYRAKTTLGKLKARGEIEFVERDGKKYVRLTARGEEALALAQEKMALPEQRPRSWDRRYRLVIFDIPEKRKRTRDRLRHEMRGVGFLRIQDSTWLYPYDCEEFVALLKAELRVGKDVLYAVVEEIENDGWIRKHFSLPSD